MLTITDKLSSFLEQKDKIGDLEQMKFVHYSALQSLAAYLEHVATINGGDCLDCTDEWSSCSLVTTFQTNLTAVTSSWETQLQQAMIQIQLHFGNTTPYNSQPLHDRTNSL